MAKQQKKSARRVPKASEPRMYGDGKPSQPEAQPAATAAPAPAATRSTGAGAHRRCDPPRRRRSRLVRRRVDRIADYSYVMHDLRRLGIVAASILGGLVVLGFIVR